MAVEVNAIGDQHNWSEVYKLADSYRQQKQWQQAAIAFQQAIALKPDFFWSYHHLGDTLSHLQQWQASATAYSQAVKLDPSFFWSWHNLGDVLFKLQQWQNAKMAYSQAVKLDPSFFWSWHNLGDVLFKLKQWDQAISIYLQAVQIKPEHQLIYQKLGTIFKQRGSLEDSIQYYRQLISHPIPTEIFDTLRTTPSALVNIACGLVKQHQTIGAIVLYYMALEIQPHQIEILQQLVLLLQQQHQLEQNITSRQESLNSELLTRQSSIITPQTQPTHISGNIVIRKNCPLSSAQLENLCVRVGWKPRSLERVKQSLDHSFSYVTAWHQSQEEQSSEQLVGFARTISDGTFHAVLLDIAIAPEYQNQGIGKSIVQTLIEELSHAKVQDITLIASPHITDFYHKLGFVSQPNNLQWMLWCPNTV